LPGRAADAADVRRDQVRTVHCANHGSADCVPLRWRHHGGRCEHVVQRAGYVLFRTTSDATSPSVEGLGNRLADDDEGAFAALRHRAAAALHS
jgi:hypothetical protein